MKSNNPLTFEERKKIEELCKDPKLSISKIGRLIGRSKTGVQQEVRKNGGRNNYNAEAASNRIILLRQNQYAEMSKNHKGIFKGRLNTERIDILEMQLAIVIEQLNKITKG